MRIDRFYLSCLLVPLVLLAAVYVLYMPGVTGPFLLDDPIHFQKLSGDDGEIDTTGEVLELVGSGSSATGRPLSFLSLLIDDNAWPAPPLEFKITNVMIHLLNTLLVFWFAYRLLMLLSRYSTGESVLLGGAIALIWAVAPIQVSSVFMTIQRMTLLAGTMSLLSLLLLTFAWSQSERNRSLIFVLVAGLAAFVGLFFKETAISTVFFAGCVGFLIQHYRKERPYLYRTALAFSALLLLSLLVYYLLSISRMDELYAKRTFTMSERVLTEGRILLDYIVQIFLPRMSETGAFHDNYMVSDGLFSPISTFWSWLFILILGIVSFIFRKRMSLLFFGVIWFLSGHVLESTFLPLELYFEHRNYLPSLGLWIMLVLGVYQLLKAKAALISFVPYALLLSFITFMSSTTWGQPGVLFHSWLRDNPDSLRARIEVIRYELLQQNAGKAQRIFLDGQAYIKQDAGYYLYGFIVDRCNYFGNTFVNYDLDELLDKIGIGTFEHASLEGLNWLTARAGTDRCDVSLEELDLILQAYLANEAFTGVTGARVSIENNMVRLATKKGDLDEAIHYLESNYKLSGDVGYLLNAAHLLATAGLFEQSRDLLEQARLDIDKSINPIERRKNELELTDTKRVIDALEDRKEKAD